MNNMDWEIVDGPLYAKDVVSAVDVLYLSDEEQDIFEINIGAEEDRYEIQNTIGENEFRYTVSRQGYEVRDREVYQVPASVARDSDELVDNLLSKHVETDDWEFDQLETI